ncbi:MAG: hypothetical protein CMJ83_14915 [Planctomycetes bacterium]|nr:hypothetical protein [Planctomycetota bacterium]
MRRTIWLVVAALALIPTLACAQGAKEKAVAALAEFKGFYKDRNEHVRKAAIEGLCIVDHVDVTRALMGCLKDRSEMVRAAAVLGLGYQRNKMGVSEMTQKMWRGRDRLIRIAIVKAFKSSVPISAYSAVLDLAEDKDWEIRAHVAELISRYPDQEGAGLGAILPLCRDKEALVRLAAMDAIVLLKNPRGHKFALTGLQDRDWRVRASSIKVCRHFRMKSSIDPLIELLKDEKGRLQDDASDALNDICDREIPGDYDRWRKWWDRVKDGYKVPTALEIAERKRRENTRRAGYDPPRKSEYPPYHGIKTRSRRILFVIDISSSMAEVVTLDERNHQAVEAFRNRYGDLSVKIDIAREELIKMVAGLKSYAKFNLVTFNAKTARWKKTMVPATSGNKNKAIKFLARLTPETVAPQGGGFRRAGAINGQTNTFEALNACFGLFKGHEFDKKAFKTDADTVFFLSDGNPTTGRITQPQTLLDYFNTVNTRAKMVVHTVAFGNSNKALMEGLARRSGGQSVVIGN